MDYSQAFVHKCQEMKMLGQAKYWLTTEGHLGEEKTATVDPSIVSMIGLHQQTALSTEFIKSLV